MTGYLEFRLVQVVAIAYVVFGGSFAGAQHLDGTWSLQQYEMTGVEQSNVSGLLVMADNRFGLIYTMDSRGGTTSGRAHAGPYAVRDDQLAFDVEWSLEHVDGVGRATFPGRVLARFTRDGNSLVLRFGSGSIQRWRRVEAGMQAPAAGAWQLDAFHANDERHEAEGLFILADDRFVLFHAADDANKGGSDLYTYGGTSRGAGNQIELTSHWAVIVGEGSAQASNAKRHMTLTAVHPGRAVLSGPDGEAYGLRRPAATER